MRTKNRGFTLVELIVVMVVAGIIAGVLVVFFRPAMQNYLAVGRRAELTDQADGAMRRIMRDIRASVPNSVRLLPADRTTPLVTNDAIEMVPASAGGRYRMAADTVWDASQPALIQSLSLDTTQASLGFDVLTPLALPNAGDWVVIGNTSPVDIYGGTTRAAISTAVPTPAATAAPAPANTLGRARITFTPAVRFPSGYDGGRFYVVPSAQGPVSYICNGMTASGGGTLFRVSGYGFNQPSLRPGTANAAILATNVSACSFTYNAASATQERGVVSMTLTLSSDGEAVTLSYATHVDNVP